MHKLNPNLDVNDINKVPLWDLGHEGGITRPINIDNLFNQMVELKNLLNECGVKWCLSHGTVLGIIRENSLLAHDDDVDIALFPSTNLEVFKKGFETIRQEMRALGYFVPPVGNHKEPINSKNNMPYYDEVFLRDGEKLEGWIFEKKEDYYIYDFPRCGNDLKHPSKYYDKLQEYEWRNEKFFIPNHIDEWLVMMYGPTWNIEDKNAKYLKQS